MKVAPPSPILTPAPMSPTVGVAGGGSSFEELLAKPGALRRERQERAFGFSELGVLGGRGPGQRGAVPDFHRDADYLVALSELATPEEPTSGEAAGVAVTANRSSPSPAGVAPTMPRPPVATTVQPDKPLPGVSISLRSAPPAPETVEEAAPPAQRSRAPAAPEAQARRLQLAVSEHNGAVQIVAGSAELSPDERARLRRAAAAVAAEFGLTLDTLTLNGSTEPHAFTKIGARHGDHRG